MIKRIIDQIVEHSLIVNIIYLIAIAMVYWARNTALVTVHIETTLVIVVLVTVVVIGINIKNEDTQSQKRLEMADKIVNLKDMINAYEREYGKLKNR